MQNINENAIEQLKQKYPEKFLKYEDIFSKIKGGDKIFLSTGCGEPQYLVEKLTGYIKENPGAFYDTQLLHIWTMGKAPFVDRHFTENFRTNAFFVGDNTRDAVIEGFADYTPVFFSNIPKIIRKKLITIDIALVQASIPDDNGYLSLGISVDITRAAIQCARIVICQINSCMPRVMGDSFIHVSDINYLIHRDEPLLEYNPKVPGDVASQIGINTASIIRDGDTIQAGYGSLPNAVLYHLRKKKHLGIHTELLTDNMVQLIKDGAVDNSRKTIDRGKTVATFCMGSQSTYDFIDNNPLFNFQPVDYTDDPVIIARQRNMVAINSALQIDLTGQVNTESLHGKVYSGIGGYADFMRGSALARNGRSVVVMQSTAEDGKMSRIVPELESGTGITLTRGDIYYVITEYGIAYLFGKNTRERAMSLISIAHPNFREHLIEKAKEKGLIYPDQAFIKGTGGIYPAPLEEYKIIKPETSVLFRPVKISDETLVKDFFYSLSDKSIYRRFIAMRKHLPHKLLQRFVVIDYTSEMIILATIRHEEQEEIIGLSQYVLDKESHYGDFAIVVRDDFQGKHIGYELTRYLTNIAKKNGLNGFTADVLSENKPMLKLFEKMGFRMKYTVDMGVYNLKINFR